MFFTKVSIGLKKKSLFNFPSIDIILKTTKYNKPIVKKSKEKYKKNWWFNQKGKLVLFKQHMVSISVPTSKMYKYIIKHDYQNL